MAVLEIPTSPDTPFYSQVSQLEGVDYGFVFVYNQRENCYYLSLETVAGAEIVKGVKLVCGVDLLGFLRTPLKPPGVMTVISTTSDTSPPGLGELGNRCQLTYIESTDARLNA